ncbi:Alanine--tRNA ligase [Rickettsiales bacterium Ac37b]|nr:Alanine--tRNA ligase [Rickettsiales bacterium Ac37b]
MKHTNHIRELFLNFFRTHNHTIAPSSPLVPYNDPSLMFTNSGMVQFKNIFTGDEKALFTRAATSQKCVRAGGKHNDLDNVGYTARHHTFFEMLGNFSFGDYFKQEAIEFAWNFLTTELAIPKQKLYVTIYHDDEEAYKIWHKITGFGDEKIIRIATDDNFWSMGDLGPCGPCSEIFYDHGDRILGGLPGQPNSDGDRYVEIWNLVFMQYQQLSNGERIKLPKASIDTGMGLERIAAVMQNVHDNYDIDLFKNIIEEIQELSNVPVKIENAASYRIIADHMRSSCFLLADGVSPSNEGRGYVLRRIMRRAMRHVHQLGCKDPLLYKLVPIINKEMSEAYPELIRAEGLITNTLQQEEERFLTTLDKGLKLLDLEAKDLKTGDTLSGNVAFKLYDTYGFPFDLTKDILDRKQILINEPEFETAMQAQRELARKAWVGSGEQTVSEIWFEIYNKFGATEFLGYESPSAQAKVIALILDNKIVEKVDVIGKKFAIVLNQTPFYAESGGQMGDIGNITDNNQGIKLEVYDTKKYLSKLHVHFVTLVSGGIKIDDIVNAEINEEYRNKLRANHTVTHLLHATLKAQLGSHVAQKGSLVASDRLRFDMSHNKPITKEEILLIEQTINRIIYQNIPISTVKQSIDDAIKSGAEALFGEKYEEEVRVVSVSKNNNLISKELCGGTHVNRTGDIGLFKIISESAIAAGIRRIEAVTGEEAVKVIHQQEKTLVQLSELLLVPVEDLSSRVTSLINDKKILEKDLTKLRKDYLMSIFEKNYHEKIGDISFMHHIVDNIPVKELRSLVEDLKNKFNNAVIIIISNIDTKLSVIIGVSKDITARISAVELSQLSATILGGAGGGGKSDLAQSGGIYSEKIPEVIAMIKDKLQNI